MKLQMKRVKYFLSKLIRLPVHIYNEIRFSILESLSKKSVVTYSHSNSERAHRLRYSFSSMLYSLNPALIEKLESFDSMRNESLETATSFKSDLYDLCQINAIVKHFNSSSIIEYGSGASTLLFYDLLNKKMIRKFVSVDESEFWATSTKSIIQSLYPESYSTLSIETCSVIPLDSKAKGINLAYGVIYDFDPNDKFDFIYIDGPELNNKFKFSMDPYVYDLIHNDTIIMIDGRGKTCDELHKNLNQSTTKWLRFNFSYPSDDTLFVSSINPRLELFLEKFSNICN